MKVVLFALTGFGNEAIKALVKNGHQISLLVTREEIGRFPYYKEENIVELAKRLGISYTFARPQETAEKIKEIAPELILVATYHRIIPEFVFNLALKSINIHPSLLPGYKGANPVFWALFNGEKETGLTAHFLSERLDGGNIILQEKIKIKRMETNGELRKRLALSLKVFIPKLTRVVLTGKFNTIKQKAIDNDYFPKIGEKTGDLRLGDPNFLDIFRAMTPYPGAVLNFRDGRYLVKEIRERNFKKCDLRVNIFRRKYYLRLSKLTANK